MLKSNICVKSSLPEVWQLHEMYDIVCIQEHWLLPSELHILLQLHVDCLSWATSAVDISNNQLVGCHTAILYKQRLARAINFIDTNELRVTAITLSLTCTLSKCQWHSKEKQEFRI